jgi:Dolichyl-phosphate-mannose-protein mannosyltransferase
MILRFVFVTWYSPELSALVDPSRYLAAANDLSFSHQSLFSVFDPPIYQYWLAFFIHMFKRYPVTLELYSIAMVAITPLFWYLWMRLALNDEKLALIGLTIFIFLPSYLSIFCFFMPETLLLPLLGLSLWLTSKASVQRTKLMFFLVAMAWGLTITTKMNAAATCAVSLGWLWRRLSDTVTLKSLFKIAILQLIVVAAIFSLTPIKVYDQMHSIVIEPGTVVLNRLLFESGNARLEAHGKRFFPNGTTGEFSIWCDCPVLVGEQARIFRPFSNWTSFRKGTADVIVDFDRLWPIYPSKQVPWRDRLRYTYENILFFFFSSTYPEDQLQNSIFAIDTNCRWLWLPITLLVLVLAIKRRRWSFPVVLAVFTGLSLMLQQTSLIEGRYRKPWEGLVIVALLDVVRSKRAAKSG